MNRLSCLRGSQGCLNCLLASKPLICKLAPLVLSLSLCLPLSSLLFIFCVYGSSLSSLVYLYCLFLSHFCCDAPLFQEVYRPLHSHIHTQIVFHHSTYPMPQVQHHLKNCKKSHMCSVVVHCCGTLTDEVKIERN